VLTILFFALNERDAGRLVQSVLQLEVARNGRRVYFELATHYNIFSFPNDLLYTQLFVRAPSFMYFPVGHV
jgi:hypothetical protein